MKKAFWRGFLTAAFISYSSIIAAAEPYVANGTLDQAGIEKEQLIKWSGDTLIQLYTYDFQSANQSIQNAHTYFTKKGFDDYQNSINNSQWLPIIQRKKYNVLPMLDDKPTVESEGAVDGIYTWAVKVPLMLYLRGPYDTNKQKRTIAIKVKRTPLADYPSGLAIDEFSLLEDTVH